jgi:serine/threonine protein kinase
MLVRKQVDSESVREERTNLEFLAQCAEPNLIQLLFWYQDGREINFVFRRYPGSLQQILEGKAIQIHQPQATGFGPILNHWLWEGMVGVIKALKFFHFPEQKILPHNIVAAHFDMKPANILVDESGTLTVADFGHAQMRNLNPDHGTSFSGPMGDPNYRPPPIAPKNSSTSPSGSTPEWTQAYDVWSMACIMTEVIEYITKGGSKAFINFRESLLKEDSSAAFWKKGVNGHYELKDCVTGVLRGFKAYQDQYLDLIVDLLNNMFSIDPLHRPTMSDCVTTIMSEDIPADQWPLKEKDEISLCGLGSNSQLRNMLVIFIIVRKATTNDMTRHTQFKRRTERNPHRCRMYLLSSLTPKRIRLALEFKKAITDGSNRSEATWVLSDSGQQYVTQIIFFLLTRVARHKEEALKPLTLFKPHDGGELFECAFDIVHPNLTFIFDDPERRMNGMPCSFQGCCTVLSGAQNTVNF